MTGGFNRIYQGHVLDVLKQFPDEFVDCVVTSPPYWGLRDYKLKSQVWDAEENCKHNFVEYEGQIRGGVAGRSAKVGSTKLGVQRICGYKVSFCSRCGAWYGSLGLEPTPDLYIFHIVQVFRELRRVLKKEGTLWLNIGDTYAGSGCGANDYRSEAERSINKSSIMHAKTPPQQRKLKGFKSKDLIGIPWRVAFALQSDGWWLRQDIIWAKPNAMPESVKDRCTRSHEYIFLLAKGSRYYFDGCSILEIVSYDDGGGIKKRNRRSVWTIPIRPFRDAHFAVFPEDLVVPMVKAGCPRGGIVLDPFIGSGTVGVVAKRLERKYVGIELNPEYVEMAEERIGKAILCGEG